MEKVEPLNHKLKLVPNYNKMANKHNSWFSVEDLRRGRQIESSEPSHHISVSIDVRSHFQIEIRVVDDLRAKAYLYA